MSFKLAQHLIQKGVISEDLIEAIFDRRQDEGDRGLTLDADLCLEGHLTPLQANEYLAQTFMSEPISLEQLQTISSMALASIEPDLAQKKKVFPIAWDAKEDSLWLVSSDSIRKSKLKALAEELDVESIKLSIINQVYFEQLYSQHYKQKPNELLNDLISSWPLPDSTQTKPEPVQTQEAKTETDAPTETTIEEAKKNDPTEPEPTSEPVGEAKEEAPTKPETKEESTEKSTEESNVEGEPSVAEIKTEESAQRTTEESKEEDDSQQASEKETSVAEVKIEEATQESVVEKTEEKQSTEPEPSANTEDDSSSEPATKEAKETTPEQPTKEPKTTKVVEEPESEPEPEPERQGRGLGDGKAEGA